MGTALSSLSCCSWLLMLPQSFSNRWAPRLCSGVLAQDPVVGLQGAPGILAMREVERKCCGDLEEDFEGVLTHIYTLPLSSPSQRTTFLFSKTNGPLYSGPTYFFLFLSPVLEFLFYLLRDTPVLERWLRFLVHSATYFAAGILPGSLWLLLGLGCGLYWQAFTQLSYCCWLLVVIHSVPVFLGVSLHRYSFHSQRICWHVCGL